MGNFSSCPKETPKTPDTAKGAMAPQGFSGGRITEIVIFPELPQARKTTQLKSGELPQWKI
jgi:hypothetical protein